MGQQKRWHLFQKYGIELEYMIVNKDTMDIMPIADKLLQDAHGCPTDEFVNGQVTWSNELVLHVIELKCSVPTVDLVSLAKELHKNILYANELLAKYNACLLGTAAHPWMNPTKETFLWPRGNAEIYESYDRIFNCKGHGWANLQSMHINLPFYDDEEFAVLHAAIRVILPLLPALAASSPILDQKETGVLDTRMIYYQKNQKAVPELTGKVIPEKVTSKRLYHKLIYNKIAEAIAPHDPKKILDPVWLNSRGCIARFDRGAIEIRILDLQECPAADLSIASFIIQVLKLLVSEKLSSFQIQSQWPIVPLYDILQKSLKTGLPTVIQNKEYLQTLGLKKDEATIKEIYEFLLDKCALMYPDTKPEWINIIKKMLDKGSLAQRILQVSQQEYSVSNLRLIYKELSEALSENSLFEVCDQTTY